MSLVQDQPVTALPELGSTETVKDFISRKLQAMQDKVDRQSSSQLIKDIHWQHIQLDRRGRDRIDRVESFSSKAQKFHAADLFDIECVILDLFEYIVGLSSNLASSLLGMFDMRTGENHFKFFRQKSFIPCLDY